MAEMVVVFGIWLLFVCPIYLGAVQVYSICGKSVFVCGDSENTL